MQPWVVAVDDPRRDDVRALLRRHVQFAREVTVPGHVYALDLDGLLDDSVTLFSLRDHGRLLGVGALKALDPGHFEVKSMHTAEAARGRGVGRAIVEHMVRVASERSGHRLSLETGSQDAFAPARAFYTGLGFTDCGPFGDYPASAHSAFMTLLLEPVGE